MAVNAGRSGGPCFTIGDRPWRAQNGKDLLIKLDMTGERAVRDHRGAARHADQLQRRDGGCDQPGKPGRLARACWPGRGCKSASISGSGVFRDADTDERARQIFFDGEMPEFQVIIPDFGIVEGPFQITAIEYAGSHNGEATYELTLASAGALTFTAL